MYVVLFNFKVGFWMFTGYTDLLIENLTSLTSSRVQLQEQDGGVSADARHPATELHGHRSVTVQITSLDSYC